MKLSDASRLMMRQFRTTDGRSFLGELIKPENRNPPNNFDNPRRLLRTGALAGVGVGDVMIDTAGRRYLLTSDDDTETPRLTLHMFRLIEMTSVLLWTRMVTGVDPVTKLGKALAPLRLGPIWCSMEQPASHTDGDLRVRELRYRVVTGAEVLAGDRLNDRFKVVTVSKQLGVTFAEVE
jgi:hypothetical protein